MHTVRLALNAMATRFELVLNGEDEGFLRAAGEESLAEIRRLEKQLSFYDSTSEVSRINRDASRHAVQLSPNLYSLLKMSAQIYQDTDGAFDITVGPLMKCWGFVRNRGSWPEESDRKNALKKTGMHQVTLNDSEYSVAFEQKGMSIDLGAIGKGYAIEEAAQVLRECGITSALLHGGTSTMVAIGPPSASEDGWSIGIADPQQQTRMLTSVKICNEAFSVSAPHGKAFHKNGKTWGHVIDPRLGYPVQGPVLSAVVHSSATVCDAVSTALLAMNPSEIAQIPQKFVRLRSLCAYTHENEINFISSGFNSSDAMILNE